MNNLSKQALFIAGFCASIFACFSLVSAQPEDYSTWPNSQRIVINTSATGAGTTQNLINFPVLVRLNYLNFPGITKALSGGADIRFARNGVPLSYEIERWVSGVSTKDIAEVWVKLDTVYGNNSTQSFIMYWGKAGVTTTSSGPAVFDTANGFQGVWHLSDASGTTANDATINHFNGTANVATTDTVGLIGDAKIFNGTSNYYDVANSASGKLNFPQHGTYTISAWANAKVVNSDFYSICNKGDYQYGLAIDNNNSWEITEFQDSPPDAAAGWEHTVSPATANAWTYVTGIRNGAAAQSLYLNGVLKSNVLQLIAAPASITRKTTSDFGIGRLTDTASNFFNGKIDEVRVESVVRSPDWVKLSYESQKAGGVCVYLDTTSSPPIVVGPNDASVAESNPLSLSVTATGSGSSTFSYAWYKGAVSAANQILGAAGTRSTFVIAAAQLSDSGTYLCVVGNANGFDTSRAAHVSVTRAKPVITVEPNDTTITQGTVGRLSVAAFGTGMLTYAWYKGPVGAGTLLTGQTGTAFPIAAAKASDSGIYYCIVTNIVGSDTSRGAHLSVTSGAPVITSDPKDTAVLVGTRFKFAVLATGVGTLTYQWYKGTLSSPIPTQTANSIVYTSAQISDSGSYICVVTNLYGSTTSRAAHLTVAPNPTVLNSVVVRGTFVDSTHVLLTISRYMQLPSTAPQLFPWYANSVVVWYRANAWPDTSATRLTFSVSQLQTKAADQYDTLVTVSRAATVAPFDHYDFLGSVYWRNTNAAIKDSLPPFNDSTNGVSIPMYDQTPIPNPLNMTFVYAPGGDSVRLTLSNFSVLTAADWTHIGVISMSYSVAGGTAFTEDISKSTVQASLVSGNSFSKTYKDSRFAGADAMVDWQVKFKGVGANESPVVTATLTVGINTINHAPIISVPTTQTATVDVPFTLNLSATDPDGNQVFWFVIQGPDSLKINMNTGSIAWTPRQNVAGSTVPVKIRATDGVLSDTTTFNIFVTPVNGPPVITTIFPITFKIDTLYSIPLIAIHEEGDALSWTVPHKPATMTIVANTLVWVPNVAGLDTITIIASDAAGSDTVNAIVQVVTKASANCRMSSGLPTSVTFSAKILNGIAILTVGLPNGVGSGTLRVFDIAGRTAESYCFSGSGWHTKILKQRAPGLCVLRFAAGGKIVERRILVRE